VKLRILDNSIRLRLTRTEVETIGAGQRVAGRTRLAPDAAFDYVLTASDTTSVLGASLGAAGLVVTAPRAQLRSWAVSDEVAIESEKDVGNGERLRLLVEKDFQCLAPRVDEDESDMYPNPKAGRE